MNSASSRSVPMSRRSMLAVAGATAVSVTVGGCSRGLSSNSESSSTLQMTFWGEGNQNAKLVSAINLFDKGDSGVSVKTQYSGLNGYYDKLATRLAGGAPPDIFQIHLPYLLEYVRRGAVRQLDDHATDLRLTELPSYIASTSKVDGHWYFALGGAATQPAILYDTTKLDQYGMQVASNGWTFAEYQSAMSQVHSHTKGKLYGSVDLGGTFVAFESYLHGRNKQLFDESGQLGFSEADLATWLNVWVAQRKSGGCVPMSVTAAGTGFDTDPIVTGKSAYSETATSRGLTSMQTLTKDSLGLLPFPAATKGTQSGTNIIPAGWWAISKHSKNVDKAVALLKFLTQDKKAALAMGLARGIPINAGLQTAIKPHLRGVDKLILDNYQQVAKGRLAPLQPYPPGAGELLQTSLPNANQTVGFGKSNVAAATKHFFTDAKRILK